MSFVGSNILAGASGQGGATGYEIERSLRFNSGDSAYLNRTPSAAGNRRTYTLAFWIKRTKIGADYRAIISNIDSNYQQGLYLSFISSDKLLFGDYTTGWNWELQTNAVFRDTSAWYHIVCVYDSTNGTEADRAVIYVNGVRQEVSAPGGYPSQNEQSLFNTTTEVFIGKLGSNTGTTFLHDGYLADFHFIDGQALAATDFGETDDNGVWQPKEFEGNYAGAYSGTTTSLSQTGWNPSQSGNIWDGNASSSSRATGYAGGTKGTVSFDPPLTNVIKVEVWTQNYVNYLNGASVSTPESTNGGWHTFYDNSGSPITLNSVGNAYNTNNTQTVDIAGIRINGSIVDSQTWTPPSGVGFASTGANSFYLPFTDNSSNAALGTDTSGNSNTWTVNNLTAAVPKESANWLAMATGTPFNSSHYLSYAFDGNPNTQAAAGQGNTMSFTPSPAITGISKIRIKARRDNGVTDTGLFTLNGTAIGGSWSENSIATVEITTLSGSAITQLTNLSWSCNPNNNNWFGVYTIEIYYDGSYKTLVTNTAGASAIDSLRDSPTNGTQTDTGAGGEVVGNYATLNPLDRQSTNGTLSNGNLDLTWATATWVIYRATMHVSSGKWYWEVTLGNNQYSIFGIIPTNYAMSTSNNYWIAQVPNAYCFYPYTGNKYDNTSSSSYATADTSASGTVYGMALDLDAGTMTYYKNGVSLGTAFTGISGSFAPAAGLYNQSGNDSYNFGQRAFAHPVSGYKALCTSNLPEPTIADGSKYFDTVLWSGDGSGAITVPGLSLNNAPGFVWSKTRNHAYHNNLWDAVRGFGSANALVTDENFAEGGANGGTLNSATSSSLTFSGGVWHNENNKTYLAWNWDAGSSNTTIAAGGLNSSVYDQSRTWSNNITTTGYSGNWWPANPKTYIFDADTTNYGHANANGGAVTVTLTVNPTITSTSSVSIYGGMQGSGTATVSINGGTAVALTSGSSATTETIVSFSGAVSSIVITKTSSGAEGLLIYGFKIDGKLLVDSGVSVTNVPTIPSTVRANPSAGFSIVKYTSADGTVGHGLSAAPHAIIAKRTDAAYTWSTFWHDLGNQKYIALNNSNAASTYTNIWGTAMPTSSVFGFNTANVPSGGEVIAYCFAPVEGYSAMGSYTGNGSADGVFIYTGFSPSWLLFKRHDAGSDWTIYDIARDPHNVAGNKLEPNTSDAESAQGAVVDILSNGFKFRRGSLENGGNDQYIYMAFASNPFKTARAR